MIEEPSRNKKFLSFIFRLIRVLIVLGIAFGLAFLLVSTKKEPEKKQIVKTPPSVKVMAAQPVSKMMPVEAFGTVKPRRLVKIAAEVPGRIDYLHPSFIAGGGVAKGDVLIRIDQRSYKLGLKAADVNIRQAKIDIERLKQDIDNLENDLVLSRANAALVKKELDRVKTLNKNQFASKNSMDKMEQQYLQAKIQLQNIQNRLSLTDTLLEQKNTALIMAGVDYKKADLALQKTRIISDFDGFVLDKFAELGEYVNPGQVLGSIFEKGHLDVDVSIPLEKMQWIESFFQNGRTPDATIIVPGLAQYQWKAKVARIKARIDEKTRTLPMTLEILNPEIKLRGVLDLRPGTFVKCTISGEIFDNIFIVPRHLLKVDNILFTVVDGHLEMKKVSILRKFEDEVFVNGGLVKGDNIILSPLPGAMDGMALMIKRENRN